MINFFELSKNEQMQDTIIRWLFKNYDGDDYLKKCSNEFIKKILDEEDINEIIEVKDVYQISLKDDKNRIVIDMGFCIRTNKANYGLLIEDKVKAKIKQNLSTYKTLFEKNFLDIFNMNNTNIVYKYVLIKTGNILEEDREKCKKNGFALYDREIFNVLDKYKNDNHIIKEIYDYYNTSFKILNKTDLASFINNVKDDYLFRDFHITLNKRKVIFEYKKSIKYGIIIEIINYTAVSYKLILLGTEILKISLKENEQLNIYDWKEYKYNNRIARAEVYCDRELKNVKDVFNVNVN